MSISVRCNTICRTVRAMSIYRSLFKVCVSYTSLNSIKLIPSSISTSFSSEMVYYIRGILWLNVSFWSISLIHQCNLLSYSYIRDGCKIPPITLLYSHTVRVHTVIDIPTERCSYQLWCIDMGQPQRLTL